MARKKLPSNLPIDKILDAALRDDNLGFCLSCGCEHDGCEPDARNYLCEECGRNEVFGAPELLIMFA